MRQTSGSGSGSGVGEGESEGESEGPTVDSVRLAAGARSDGSVVEEEVLVTQLSDHRFRLLESPGLILGLAAGDVFEGTRSWKRAT